MAESITKLETEQRQYSSNYTGGEKAGQSWTDKVMGVKESQDKRQEQGGGGGGGGEVEEDEWVSSYKSRLCDCNAEGKYWQEPIFRRV